MGDSQDFLTQLPPQTRWGGGGEGNEELPLADPGFSGKLRALLKSHSW